MKFSADIICVNCSNKQKEFFDLPDEIKPTGREKYRKKYWLFGPIIKLAEFKYENEFDIDSYSGRAFETIYFWKRQ